jgi:tripartite-type tricarboxylate transporter receptor subunit TctC
MAFRFSRASSSFALTVAAGLSAAVALTPQTASAQKYPDRPVRIILPLGAGGVGDISTRIVAEKLGEKLGQRFIVENMPAAGGIAAARAATQAEADGYTLILFTGGVASSVPLFKDLGYDPLKEFTPISSMGYFDCLAVTNAEQPFKSLEDFLKAAKEKPGTLNVGVISAGGVQLLTANYLKLASGVDFVIVPFRTTPDAIVGLLRNDVQMVIDFYAALKGGIQDNKLRPVAWTGPKPSPALPDLKTAEQQGVKNFQAASWNSYYAKAGTPAAIIATLNKAIGEVVADPEVKRKLLDLGIDSRASTPEGMDAQMRGDIAKWTEVIAKAGIEKR